MTAAVSRGNSGRKIALFGNPNVGKSVIFGHLSGHYAHVSNFPGTTVEIARAKSQTAGGETILWLDAPGINSLVPISEDEQVARDILLREKIDGIVQVADSKNLRRALLLTLELAEMGIPFALALNMEDESESRGIVVDKQKLASLLGIPVVGTVAIHGKGLDKLRESLGSLAKASIVPSYSREIEEGARAIERLLPETVPSRRGLSLMLIEGDRSLEEWLRAQVGPAAISEIDRIVGGLSRRFDEPLSYVIDRERWRLVDRILREVFQQGDRKNGWIGEFLGRVSMHPVWGFFVLAGVLFALYEFVGNLGAQVAVEWLEETVFAKYLNPWASQLFSWLFSFSPFLRDLFVGDYGLITMGLTYALAIILPIVTTFFLFFSLLEDCGYLPRLSVMMNRIFRFMGLNGKAVVPMVLGLGCDTMATMTARILETKKEKIIITLLLALGVPCSAQLGIILGMLASLPSWATLVWLGVVGGSLVSVGFLAAKILPGGRSEFVAEIPPIRRPTIGNIVTKTSARLEWYLKEVIPIFLVGTLALFLLDKLALLTKIQALADPLVGRVLKLPPEATEAFLIGFLRRDYGATHFFRLYGEGRLDAIQTVVALVVITLFVPCLANALMIVKERGAKTAAAMLAFIYPFAFFAGGLVNFVLRRL